MDSSGPIAQEESNVTAPNNLITQQVIAASQEINSMEMRNATPTVMVDRRVPFSKYCSIAPTSTEIAKKTSVSHKDKTFDNIDMLDKALRASNLLSMADGSRKPPDVNKSNCSGYTAEAIKPTIKADGSSSLTVIAEDDYYKYFADSIVAYTFTLSIPSCTICWEKPSRMRTQHSCIKLSKSISRVARTTMSNQRGES